MKIRTLRTKLLLAALGIAALIAGICLLALHQQKELGKNLDYVTDVAVPLLEASDDAAINTWESLKIVEEYMNELAEHAEGLEGLRREYEGVYAGVGEALAAIGAKVDDEQLKPLLNAAKTNLEEYDEHVAEAMEAHRTGSEAEAEILAETKRHVDEAVGSLDRIAERADKLTEEANARADETAAGAAAILWAALVTGILMAIATGFLMSWIIATPVNALAHAVNQAAAGDLDVEVKVKTSDEIGVLNTAFNTMIRQVRKAFSEVRDQESLARKAQAAAEETRCEAEGQKVYLSECVSVLLAEMNRFAAGDLTVHAEPFRQGDDIAQLFDGFNGAVANLGRMIQQVSRSVEDTASASSEISAATDQLASSAQEQSNQCREVAVAVEEMVRTIIENSQTAADTSEAARENGALAGTGGQIVSQTVDKIRRIAAVVADSARTVEQLGERSRHIGAIVQTIDEIADQTNLLALNAAIEAARAGDQGRGFAVVADEVRKLAERTSGATREIAAMIQAIQSDTLQAVQAMQRGEGEVREGITLADQAGEALSRIVQGTDRTLDMVTQIAAAGEEQSGTSEQIARSIDLISAVSNESAAGLSQIAETTQGLNRLTEDLRGLLARFKTSRERSVYRPAISDQWV